MCHFPAAVKREASVEAGDTIAFLYGTGVNNAQLFSMGSDTDLVARHHGDLREQRAFRLPALGAAACVVVRSLAGDGDFDLVAAAFAQQLAAGEIGCGGWTLLADGRMDRVLGTHGVTPCEINASW